MDALHLVIDSKAAHWQHQAMVKCDHYVTKYAKLEPEQWLETLQTTRTTKCLDSLC